MVTARPPCPLIELGGLGARPTSVNRTLLLCLPLLLTAACASADRDVAAPQEAPSPSASGPAGSEPAAAFTVAPDGTGDAREGGTALKRCLSLPSVGWKQPYAAAPAVYRVTMDGPPITAFGDCMEDVQGYAAVPMSDAHASFVDQCAGDRRQYVVPSYIGMFEEEAMRADPPAAPPQVSSTRVTARDGDCLPVTADFRTDRVDLIVQDGQVIWAGLPDPTGTGSTTGTAPAPAATASCRPLTLASPGQPTSPPVCPSDG